MGRVDRWLMHLLDVLGTPARRLCDYSPNRPQRATMHPLHASVRGPTVATRTGLRPEIRRTVAGAVGCPSGQWEQTVNLPAYAYVGSNPTPTIWFNLAFGSTADR